MKESLFFGNYMQGKSGEKRPIEWLVLESNDKGKLLISKFILDTMPYHGGARCLWETSHLRQWLNDTFLLDAFSQNEQRRIAVSHQYLQSIGDAVFLLTKEQVGEFFASDEDRLAIGTEYAVQKGLYVYWGNLKSYWWVSSRGRVDTHSAFVNYDGFIFTDGRKVSAQGYGIRPCIFIKNNSKD